MLKAALAASALSIAALAVSALATPSAALPLGELQKQDNAVALVRYRHVAHAVHIHGYRFAHRGHVRGGVVAYGYGPGCAWLHQRAVVTGNPYWWHRYRVCRGWY